MNPGYFTQFVKKMRDQSQLIVQPRMGFGTVDEMRDGLTQVKFTKAPTIGTLTLDSYTRVNKYDAAKQALLAGHKLNGYPIITHGANTTKKMLRGLIGPDFPVQVRHGTAFPQDIFRCLLKSGLDATEGGPVSYCLPYSRVPLAKAIDAWTECAKVFGQETEKTGCQYHLESFGGCMLGQLCPPSLLIAITILECLFFKFYGVQSVSLSYAQGTSSTQDLSAIAVLRKLADRYLSDIHWHVVIYTFMGVFPVTTAGAYKIISESAKIAALGGCERLIVKTPAEGHRIPTIDENVASLEMAFFASNELDRESLLLDEDEYCIIYREAETLIEAVLEIKGDIGYAINFAFQNGWLDVPYCLHQDNCNKARCYIDDRGYLKWATTGSLAFGHQTENDMPTYRVSSIKLLEMLSYVKLKYDDI